MALLDLYHRTDEDAAALILAGERMLSKENTQEAYFSTQVDGQAVTYGPRR